MSRYATPTFSIKLHDFILRLEVEHNIHQGLSRLVKITLMIMLVTHVVGCFWFLIGLTGGEGDLCRLFYNMHKYHIQNSHNCLVCFPGELNGGWVFRYYLETSPKATQYVASMYWAFSTLTTVGYVVSFHTCFWTQNLYHSVAAVSSLVQLWRHYRQNAARTDLCHGHDVGGCVVVYIHVSGFSTAFFFCLCDLVFHFYILLNLSS